MRPSATVYRMVTEDHVCPFGIKAKDLLKRRGFEVDDRQLSSRAQTDAFKAEHEVETTPQIFIDGERIGGYDALRQHFGLRSRKAGGPSYQPVVALFALTAAVAVALGWANGTALIGLQTLLNFVALSMCVLALTKLQDLDAFSNQFITYDLLARRFVPYAYIYPFAEAFAGLGMLAQAFKPLVASVALFIGLIGALSVIKAVYIDRRELKCACVGGNSNVPLGFVSLTENLMMILTGTWMLFT